MNETTTKRRRQFRAEDRGRWIEQYKRSGQRVRDFCRELSPGTLPFPQLRLPATTLLTAQLPGTHLLVVENERALHLLPQLHNTVAILAAGRNLTFMSAPWLKSRHVAYWG